MSQNTEEAWERYRKCKSGIRNEVDRQKRAEYQVYIKEIEKKDSAKAIEQIYKMQRMRSRRTKRNKMNGRPLDRMLFSAHVSNTCQDDSKWRPKAANFECPSEMRSAIYRALEKAPTKKSTGLGRS